MARQLPFHTPMPRIVSLTLSALFHLASAGMLVAFGLGGFRAPEVALSTTRPTPLSFDLAEPTVTLIDFSTPTLQPTRLEVDEVPPVEVPPDLTQPDGVAEPERPVAAPEKPAPALGRPLPPSLATQRVTVPAPPPAAQVETEQVAVEIYNPPPEYPLAARRRKIEGYVIVEVKVLKDGSPGETKIVEQSDFSAFGESALQSIRTWKFQPALRDGEPVESITRVRFTFKLR